MTKHRNRKKAGEIRFTKGSRSIVRKIGTISFCPLKCSQVIVYSCGRGERGGGFYAR